MCPLLFWNILGAVGPLNTTTASYFFNLIHKFITFFPALGHNLLFFLTVCVLSALIE